MWFSRPKRRFGISAEEILKQERGIALAWPLDRDRLRSLESMEALSDEYITARE
jgi:hypothetical protein